jgi:uncharacterized cupredoxin-like copper-binding protein
MKRIALLSLFVVSILLMAACGSAATAATKPQAASSGNGTQVDITLADNTIQASQTTFKVGVPYTFVIKNTGHHAHNFNINPPVSVAGSLDAALSGALLSVNQDQLAVGSTATADYTFPASAVGAQFEFSCLIPSHYESGMRLAITVTQ